MLSTASRNIGGISYSTLEVNSSVYIIKCPEFAICTMKDFIFILCSTAICKVLSFCDPIDYGPACYKEFNLWGLVTLIVSM